MNKQKQGKANRAKGKRFEIKVRHDLEKKGWIVFRNSNDVEFIGDCTSKGGYFKQAKSKWNPFTRSPMTLQSGFPDFVCIREMDEEEHFLNTGAVPYRPSCIQPMFEVQFVECKLAKYLDKTEKEKVEWIIKNFRTKVVVASRGEKRGEIYYE